MQTAICVVTLLILAAAMAELVKGDGQYTIIGPGTLHSNGDYNVAVAVHHIKQPVQLKVAITGPSFNESQDVTLDTTDQYKQLTFKLPPLKPGDYNLTAEGVSGLKFKNTTKLNFVDFKPYIKIQTDKSKYKPGDVINFRVLFLDENLRPAQPSENAVIYFEDQQRNRIQEIKNFKTINGVYTGKFELSEYASLGSWRLQVQNGGTYPDMRVWFDVEKYVLPKFSIKMEATENVAVQDGDMQVVVRANYTYGKPVNGKVLLLLELDGTTIFSNVNGESVREEKPSHSTVRTADMINGKAKFDLNLKEYESYLPYKTSASYIRITATVEEEFTGVKINETGGTLLYPYRYHMNCHNYENCYQFHADVEQEVSFKLTYIDGTELKDTKSVVRAIYTEGIRKNYIWSRERNEESELPKIDNKKFTFESHMNESGIAVFKIKLPDLPDIENFTRYYEIELEYAGERRELFTTYPYREPKKVVPNEQDEPPKDYFKVDVQYKKDAYSLNPGEEAIFTFNSSIPLKYFIYNIIGRGNIQKTERVDLPEPIQIYNLTLTPTFLLSPYGRLYAYYIDDTGELRYAETTFHVNVVLQNQINITAPTEVKPGTDVTLEIKTAPNSFVGLTAVDQSVLLLGSNNDINVNDFNWRLSRYDTHTPWQGGYSYYPGDRSGVVTLTNGNFFYNRTVPEHHFVAFASGVRKMTVAHDAVPVPEHALSTTAPMAFGAAAADASSSANIAVRKNFEETWIFADIEYTEEEVFKWTKTIPDTITSWVLSAFSVHPKKGLGITGEKTTITTFQPFFISVRLPYSVKRGEVINVPALIFNYLNKNLDVEVTLDNTDEEYDFLDVSNEVISEMQRKQSVRVPANEAAGVAFLIRPKTIGNIMLKFKAVSLVAGDAIHKTLKVVPEGVTQYGNRAYFVNLKDMPEFKGNFELELPAEYVADSQHVEFAVIGDLLGPVIHNLENLVRLPTGCGEQTMSSLVSNYLIYDYLKSIDKLTSGLESRIKRNLLQGYQNILNYRHDDGSFSSFGPRYNHNHNYNNEESRNGSTWLTAYVIRSLSQIAKHVNIDDKILSEGYKYLLNQQAENGSFAEKGEYFYNSQRSPVTLTSSVLLALLTQKEAATKQIGNAINYLNEHIVDEKLLLPKAVATYALQRAQPEAADKHVSNLKALAKSEGGRTWWSESKEVQNNKHITRWWYFVFSNDVEITSYALLTLLEHETIDEVLPIIKWLVAQRNSYGGFGSTQDTVVGLTALIKFAQKAGYEAAVLNVDVQSHGGSREKIETVKVTKDNGLLLQRVELPKGTKSIDFHAKGTGAALMQISYQYNIVEKESKPSFNITSVLQTNTPEHKLELEVCVEYVEDKSEASNMAILEINLPSGYTADATSFENIQTIHRVRLVETKNADSVIVVYFESLPNGEIICIPIEAFKTFEVSQQKPAPIVLYDYYDTNKKATDFYQIESKI